VDSEQAAREIVLHRLHKAPLGSSVAFWIYGPDDGTGGRSLLSHAVVQATS
jgi:hypothetical protein